jgi:hypothetical protein
MRRTLLLALFAACAPQSRYTAPVTPSSNASSDESSASDDDEDTDGAGSGSSSSGWYCYEEKNAKGSSSACEREVADCREQAHGLMDMSEDDSSLSVTPCKATEVAYCIDYTPVGKSQISFCTEKSDECEQSRAFTIKTKDDPDYGVEPGTEISDCEERR